MSGRRLILIVLPIALALTALTFRQATRRWQSSQIANQVFNSSMSAASGRLPRSALIRNLEMLGRAEALDPSNVTLPMMRGSQHLLLRDAQAALRAYEQALALEPRSELYLNIGRAHRLAGDDDAAAAAFGKAVQLDRRLRRDLRSFFERRRRTVADAVDEPEP